jgi:Fanconi-associated nuclease 1
MINMRQIKFVDYDIKLTIKIFEDREALLRYQNSLEYESELLDLANSKEFEQAFELFNDRVYEIQKTILDPVINARDQKLPSYLRRFTAGSIYCKVLMAFADVCERLKDYRRANEIYDFLLNRQHTYGQSCRARWFIRTTINYESHLKEPIKALETMIAGLADKQTVRKAGRLGLFKRLVKMSETKRYLKVKELKTGLASALIREQYHIQAAPVVEIEGTILHSEFIPGRKNVFIQNFETDSGIVRIPVDQVDDAEIENSCSQGNAVASQSKMFGNSYGLSVESVALKHYFDSGIDFKL